MRDQYGADADSVLKIRISVLSLWDGSAAGTQRSCAITGSHLAKDSAVPRNPMQSPERNALGTQKHSLLQVANVVFLSPGNGAGAETDKLTILRNIRLLRKLGRSTVSITFPVQKLQHNALLRLLRERLVIEASAKTVIKLRSNVSAPRTARSDTFVKRRRWFPAIEPGSKPKARIWAFAITPVSAPARVQPSGSLRELRIEIRAYPSSHNRAGTAVSHSIYY